MDTKELLQAIVLKAKRYKLIILLAGVLFAALAFFYSRSKRIAYTSRATVFPLTSPTDKQISSNMLSGILGIGDAPKSFSEEATINIIELASSRSIRQAVAVTRLPQFGNKTIAELLINDINEHRSFLAKETELPKDSMQLAVSGSEILEPNIVTKLSKNGVLEIFYTGNRPEYITPVSNVIIDKLGKFYIDLKRRKAQEDYNFTLDKIDSLQRMIDKVDRSAVGMQMRTMFTPSELLEYAIPKENISSEKARILRQRDMYINNRDEAVWRLQKVTPVIAMLDKPDAPFTVKKSPAMLMLVIGFVLGCILSSMFLFGGLLLKYIKDELYKSIFGK